MPALRSLHRLDVMSAWEENGWVALSQCILDSYNTLLGQQLSERNGSIVQQAESLFNAPFVVIAHDRQTNPILCYGNNTALQLWKISIPVLLQTPSRETAEPVHRDERAILLERTSRDGYVDDYRGIRIATNGQRFLIERATVWNLKAASGEPVGQAATFNSWKMLDSQTLLDG